jgi:hypothetical protein
VSREVERGRIGATFELLMTAWLSAARRKRCPIKEPQPGPAWRAGGMPAWHRAWSEDARGDREGSAFEADDARAAAPLDPPARTRPRDGQHDKRRHRGDCRRAKLS